MKVRIFLLAAAAALVLSAVLARVWLASTGAYTGGPLSVPLRIASTVALAAGLILATAVVAWPVRRRNASDDRQPGGKAGR